MSAGPDILSFADGTEMEFLERPAGPGDALLMEFRLPHGSVAPPPHIHPHTAETYEVTEGELEVLIGREWHRLAAGESATVPAGERHTFRNESGGRTVTRNIHDPHHDFETYIRRVAALAASLDDVDKLGLKGTAQMAMIWRDHDDLIRPSDPPVKIGMAVLGRVGRMFGLATPQP